MGELVARDPIRAIHAAENGAQANGHHYRFGFQRSWHASRAVRQILTSAAQSRPHSRVRASDSAVCSSVPASTGGGATQRSSGGGSGQTTTVRCWTVARRDAQAGEQQQHGDAEGEPPHIFSSAVRSGSGIRQPAAQSLPSPERTAWRPRCGLITGAAP